MRSLDLRQVSLLVCSYATRAFGSRRIELSTYDNVPVRLLSADNYPYHDTISPFRRGNRALLSESFAKVLPLAQESNLANGFFSEAPRRKSWPIPLSLKPIIAA